MLSLIKYVCICCFIVFSVQTGEAQSCTGSLGDPVVNIDFGHGPNAPVPLAAARSDLRFTNSICPEGDAYALASGTNHCFNDTWHTLAEDHTPGDINGYMMLVNPDAKTIYSDTIALCGGTTYQFSIWLLNIDSSTACGGGPGLLRPRVILSIEAKDGSVLEMLATGDVEVDDQAYPAWHQYSFFFTLPDAYSDVVMRVTNDHPPGGCGNDLAIDDISIRPCGLLLSAAFAVNASQDTLHFCESDNKTVVLKGSVQSGFDKTSFQWQESSDKGASWADIANANDPQQFSKTFTTAGLFQYRITASAGPAINTIRCRTLSKALNILVDAVPVPKAANSSPVCVGAPISFSATTADFYQWSGPGGFTATGSSPLLPASSLNNNGVFNVLATTRGGCIKQDSTVVLVSSFPTANAGRDTSICMGSSTILQASGGIRYEWTPATGLSETGIANPVSTPGATTTYTVAVSNQYNCVATDNVLVTVLALPAVDAGRDLAICAGTATSLQGTGTGSYLWSPATGLTNATIASPVAAPPVSTVYTLTVKDAFNCSNTDSVLVSVFLKPFANAGPDKVVPDGQSVVLNGMISGDTSNLFWTPMQFISDPYTRSPVVSPIEDITYTLHVGSGSVCGIATDDVFVHVNKTFLVPNAFSPNGDGINDTWNIQAINRFPAAEIRVYNRYGQPVFYSKGYNKPWDGRLNGNPLPAATYYYVIDKKNATAPVQGAVLLIR